MNNTKHTLADAIKIAKDVEYGVMRSANHPDPTPEEALHFMETRPEDLFNWITGQECEELLRKHCQKEIADDTADSTKT